MPLNARFVVTALIAAVACSAVGPSVAAEGVVGPEDVAVADLWSKVRAGCLQPGGPDVIVDHAGVARGDFDATDALRTLIQTKVDAAFDAYFSIAPGAHRVDIPPVERDAMKRYLAGETLQLDSAAAAYKDRYLMVISNITRTPSGETELSLTARGLSGCNRQSISVPLPEEMVGDPVERLTSIFDRAATSILKVARTDRLTIHLSAEIDGEGGAPPRWTDAFVEDTQLALKVAREREVGNIRLPNTIKIRPVEEGDDAALTADEGNWRSRVIVEPRENGYRIRLNVQVSDDAEDIVERGLVSLDDLPSVPVDELAEQSRNGKIGRLIELARQPQRFSGVLKKKGAFDDFVFQMREAGIAEFVVTPERPGAPLPTVKIFDVEGTLIKEREAAPLPEQNRLRLPPGLYRLRVGNPVKSATAYELSARADRYALFPTPSASQQFTRVYRDWLVGQTIGPDGSRVCFAITAAVRWSPLDWRPIKPFIFLSVDELSPTVDPIKIDQRFDLTKYYDADAPIAATIASGTRQWRIPFGFMGTDLQSLASGQMAAPESLAGMTLGAVMSIEGTAADRRPAHVEYSLLGYQAAINHILTDCNREALRGRLAPKRT